jgi:hypothetical protein
MTSRKHRMEKGKVKLGAWWLGLEVRWQVDAQMGEDI